MPLDDRKPDISYPCRWRYRVIGEGDQDIRAAIAAAVRAVLDDDEHEIEPSHTSRSGRYISLQLSVVVNDERQRLELGASLQSSTAVRYVL